MTKSGHAGCLDRRRGSRRDLRRLGVAMQVTCGGAVVVLEVGEEEPGGATKTMRGWRHPVPRELARWKPATSLQRPCADGGIPRRGRWRGGSQRCPCEVTVMTTCSDATARWDGAAAGRESVQRRENHQEHTCQRRHVGSRRHGPKAVTLWPEGAMQRQPDARTVVGACSGTYLAEMCARSGYQTDGGAVRQVLDDGT
jgi:hypothetical protein